MTLELLSLLGGGVAGFVFRMIASQAEANQRLLEGQIRRVTELTPISDDSADRAAARGGIWMRRFIVLSVMMAVVFLPFILALMDKPVFVEQGAKEWWDFLGLFSGGFTKVAGFLILEEVRTSLMAIVGFYFGQATVNKGH